MVYNGVLKAVHARIRIMQASIRQGASSHLWRALARVCREIENADDLTMEGMEAWAHHYPEEFPGAPGSEERPQEEEPVRYAPGLTAPDAESETETDRRNREETQRALASLGHEAALPPTMPESGEIDPSRRR